MARAGAGGHDGGAPAFSTIFVGEMLVAGWAAGIILVGALFILAEILSAQVILSQIGNILIFCGSATAAWLLRGRGLSADTGMRE